MKHVSLHCLLAIVAALACTLPVSAQDQDKPSTEAAQAAELEAWLKYGTPGEPHKHLQKLAGEWKIVCKTYEPGADKPETAGASVKFESILGGRYLRQTFKGTMAGMPYEGIGLMGYDNAKQKTVGTWIDSYSTRIMQIEGKYDADTHTVTDIGTGSGPQGEMKYKLLTHYLSDDQFTFTMYMLLPGDQEVKMMEMEYTRKK